MKKNSVFTVIVLACLWNTITAQNFSIIKDVNDSKDSYPTNYSYYLDGRERGFTILNGVSYFSSTDGIHGSELWRSDGTKTGTYMVKDINPVGTNSSSPSWITASGNEIFFIADDGVHGGELWKSDGTAGGTVLVKDIIEGSVGSFPYMLVDVNGVLYFIGLDLTNGSEIWKSDGTEGGTYMVKDLSPGLNYQTPVYLTKIKNRLWFVLNSTYSATDGLYSTDGTDAGTIQIFSSMGCGQMLNIGNKVFFVNYDSNYGSELWVTDGVNANIVKDIVTGADGSFPSDLVNLNGILYFSAGGNPYYAGSANRELWRSDGTSDGTYQAADIYSGIYNSSSPSLFTVLQNQIFFTATNEFGTGLWKTDGTSAGTVLIKPFNPANIVKLTAAQNVLYFSSYTDANGQELWISDGTNSGTKLVKDIFPGMASANPAYLAAYKNNLLFTATNNVTGIELWKTNGTDAGTVLVKDINKSTTSGSNPWGFASLDSTALFLASTNATGVEIWRTNGTRGGTQLVKDIYPGSQNGNDMALSIFSPAGNNLVLIGHTPAYGNELWKTNGTNAGTQMIKDLSPGAASSNFVADMSDLTQFHASGNKTYFVLSNNPNGGDINLWVTDATESGTQLVSSFLNDSYLRDFKAVNNKMMFTGFSYYVPTQLMVTDGTAGGTIVINGIDPKAASFREYKDSAVFFNTNDNNFWVSDGTNAGTHMIKSNLVVDAVDFDFYPRRSASVNGNLAFAADDQVAGTELWISNGTTAGTKLIKDINPGIGGSYPNNFALINTTLFFTADDGAHGRELWKSDGTKKGTVLVKDITAGISSSQMNNLTNANGILYFTVADSLYNPVLWQTDGTEAGTHVVADNNFPALLMSNFSPWLVLNNKMYFMGTTVLTGSEPAQAILTSADISALQFAGNLQNKNAVLNWHAVNENNINAYILQRSSNGIDFTAIRRLSASKLSSGNNYNYTDQNISESASTKIYYRLQQLNSNDEIVNSKTVAIDLTSPVTINVMPNPVKNNFQLDMQLKKAQMLLIRVSDAGGNIVLAENRNMAAGSSVLNYKAFNWAPGIYILSAMLQDGTRKEIKIIKQ